MNIPFDQIYNFVNAIIKDNKVIYRFQPTGSKNLESLTELTSHHFDFQADMNRVVVIMHDQEPLDFENFNSTTLKKSLPNWMLRHSGDWQNVLHVPDVATQLYNLNLGFIRYGLTPYDKNILVHSELNSEQCKKYQNHGFETVYWWSHAVIAQDWYRYASHDPNLIYNHKFKFDFNVYNRAWSGTREYRLVFSDLVLEHDLARSSSIKFNSHDAYHYSQHVFANNKFSIKNNLEQLPINNLTSTASADYNADDYNNAAIDVVLETLFDDSRIHLTEKILRPIACGKPFILASTANSLKVLEHYGFQTFSSCWDESYDKESDSLVRIQKIINLMMQIQKLPTKEKLRIFKESHRIAEFNKRHFFSKKFSSMIIDELKQNYWQAKAKCEGFKTKSGVEQIKKYTAHIPILKEIYDALG